MDDDHHPYWTHNTMPVSFLFLFFIIHKIDDEEKKTEAIMNGNGAMNKGGNKKNGQLLNAEIVGEGSKQFTRWPL